MVEKFDVAIVGAGPAGSVVACHLADSGLKVALFEKHLFPRSKSCGDGVTVQGLEALIKVGLNQWQAQFPAFEALRFSSPGGTIVDIPLQTQPHNLTGRIIPRRLLDAEIARQAERRGAKLYQRTPIDSITRNASGMVLKSGRQTYHSRLIILAEGSHATLARSLGLVKDGSELMAARQYLTGDSSSDRHLEIHFQSSILPGYNWLFPDGSGRINVGTGTFMSRTTSREISLRAELERFKSDPILHGRLDQTEPDSPVMGHPLRTQFGESITHSDNILVVGDTAGLVNPFTGVGIGPAMKSAELAAGTALLAFNSGSFEAAQLAPYSRRLQNDFAADRKAALKLRDFLSKPNRLDYLFKKMQLDSQLALLFGEIIFDKRSPRSAYKMETLLKALF